MNETNSKAAALMALFFLWACQSANDKMTALADEYCACPDKACADAAKAKSIALYEEKKDEMDDHVLRKVAKKVNSCRKQANPSFDPPAHNESPAMRNHRIRKGCIKICEKSHKKVFSPGYKACMGGCLKDNGI